MWGLAQPVFLGAGHTPGESVQLAVLQVGCQARLGCGEPGPCCHGGHRAAAVGDPGLRGQGGRAGRAPAGFTFPGSQARREAAFPVRRRLSPCWLGTARAPGAGLSLMLGGPNERCGEPFIAKWAVMAFCRH